MVIALNHKTMIGEKREMRRQKREPSINKGGLMQPCVDHIMHKMQATKTNYNLSFNPSVLHNRQAITHSTLSSSMWRVIVINSKSSSRERRIMRDPWRWVNFSVTLFQIGEGDIGWFSLLQKPFWVPWKSRSLKATLSS